MKARNWGARLLLVFGLATCCLALQAQSVQRIAIVNSTRILQKSVAATHAKLSVENEFGPREKDLVAQIEVVNKQMVQLNADVPASNDPSQLPFVQKIRVVNGKLKDLQRQKWALIQERTAANQQLTERVISLAKRAVQHVANEQRFDIVLTDALFVSPSYDITDKVIEYMDAESSRP